MKKFDKYKRGVTLVEVIVAMAIFTIMATTFIMTVSFCLQFHKQSLYRLRESNKQATDLENFSGVVDYESADVAPINRGSNKYAFTFDFSTGDTIVNNKNSGYVSKSTSISQSGLAMRYFSPIEQLDLDVDEYWVTISNFDDLDQLLTITAGSNVIFFNNEKEIISATTLNAAVLAEGGKCSFGVKLMPGASINNAFSVNVLVDDPDEVFDLTPYTDSERYAFIYLYNDEWKTKEEFDNEFVGD